MQQHISLRLLVGKQFHFDLRDADHQQAGNEDDAAQIVHIFSPSSPNFKEGLESIRFAPSIAGHRRMRAPLLLAIPSGLVWDEGQGRFYCAPSAPAEDELQAVSLLVRRARFQGTVGLVKKNSSMLQLVTPESAPVNILLRADARIVAVVAGAQRHKIQWLLQAGGLAFTVPLTEK